MYVTAILLAAQPGIYLVYKRGICYGWVCPLSVRLFVTFVSRTWKKKYRNSLRFVPYGRGVYLVSWGQISPSGILGFTPKECITVPTRTTLPLESASQWTSPAYGSRRLITLIWSHTCQFVISFITTVTTHYSFSLPRQAQNSSFPQIFFSVVQLPFHPPDWKSDYTDWLHGLQVFFVFLGHVGFNFGMC